MTIQQAHRELVSGLTGIYDLAEATNIAGLVMEYLTGYRNSERLLNKQQILDAEQQQRLDLITSRLNSHMPLQYVLQEAWFAGMKLYVDERVLIPRPETEELVDWIIRDYQSGTLRAKSALDIGTGSGCIALALKKNLPSISMRATDASEGALEVAVTNALQQALQVYFIRNNFLDETGWSAFGRFDLIVSNPPYIKSSEAASMHKNVLEFEPHLALFVPDEDALVFYRKIAAFGKDHLEDRGAIYLEINEALGEAVCQLFEANGYKTELRKDLQGKERMVKAWRRY